MARSMLIGRSEELAEVAQILTSDDGHGASIVIAGEPGVGKTTFLARVEELARANGFTVLACTGVEGDLTVGYGALHEVLHPILHLAPALPPRQRTALLGAFGLGDDDGLADRLLLSLGSLGLLEEAAARQPVAVIIDDLHWIDRSSADVFDFLARRRAAAPIVVIAAVRSEFLSASVGL